MTTYQNDTDVLNALLKIGPKDNIGARLIAQWGNITTLAQNLDVIDVTDRQRESLRAAFSIHFIREEKPTLQSPAEIAALLRDLEIEPQEHLVVLCLNRRNEVIKRVNLYKGSANSAQVRVAEVFREAIVLNASAIIIAHNHPSGDPTPSPDDVALTRAIVNAGKLLNIDVLDHVVIGLGRWISLKERGIGF